MGKKDLEPRCKIEMAHERSKGQTNKLDPELSISEGVHVSGFR